MRNNQICMYSTFISVKAINRLNFNFNKLLEIKNKSIVSQIKTHANISMHSIRMGLKPSSSPNIINARPSMPIIIIYESKSGARGIHLCYFRDVNTTFDPSKFFDTYPVIEADGKEVTDGSVPIIEVTESRIYTVVYKMQ